MNFKAEDPEKIKFTLTVTLPLGEWKRVKQTLGPLTCAGEIYESIQEMINQAEATFFPPLK